MENRLIQRKELNFLSLLPFSRVKIAKKNNNSMKARFNGKCVECGEAIKVGKEILKNSKDQWVHKACSDLEEELP